MDVLHFLFGVFGNVTALFLFLAPAITFKRILSSRSAENFSGIPYVMTLLNCLLSACVGFLNDTLDIIRGSGAKESMGGLDCPLRKLASSKGLQGEAVRRLEDLRSDHYLGL